MKTTILSTITAICLLFSISATSQITVTDTIYIDTDALVKSSIPRTNQGDSPFLTSNIYNGKDGYIERGFFIFDVSWIPSGAEVTQATLHLFGINHVGYNKSYIQAVGGSWDEYSITYDNQPPLLKNEQVFLDQSISSDQDYLVDIAGIVNKWADGSYANNGLALRIADVSLLLANGLSFGSSDNTDPAKKPFVVITYSMEIPKPKLVASDCGLQDMPINKLLTAESFSFAQQYRFMVINPVTGENDSIDKPTNSFRLTELDMPIEFDKEYEIYTKIMAQAQWGGYGEVCKNMTKEITFNGCDTAFFTVEIDTDIDPTDSIEVSVNLPPGVLAVGDADINYTGGTLNVNIDDQSNPNYQLTGINSSNLVLTYYAIIDCESFTGGNDTVHNEETILINGSLFASNDLSYSIATPYFEFDATSSLNIDYTADFQEQFERVFYYKYDSETSIDCEFIFKDKVWATMENSWVRLDTIELISPSSGYSIIDTVVSDSVVVLKVGFEGLNMGDQIIIRELVTRISCENGNAPDNSITIFNADYGCPGRSLCAHVNTSNTTVLASGDAPQVYYELLNPNYQDCWSDTIIREMKVVNNGTADASSIAIQFYHNILDITDIDESDMMFFTRDAGGIETPITDTTIDTDYDIGLWYVTTTRVDINRELAVGDSIFFRYKELVNCIPETNYNSYFNNLTRLHYDGYPTVIFAHGCGNLVSGYPMPPYTGSHWMPLNWTQDFSLTQYFNSLVGTMEGEMNQEEWFDVASMTPLKITGWGMFWDEGFIFDVEKSELQVKLVLSPGLGLVDTLCYMYSNNPSAPGDFLPVSVEKILGPGGTGTGDTIIAHFKLGPSFYVPPTNPDLYFQSPSSYYKFFFSDFNVRFRVRSYCAPQFGGGLATLSEEFYLVPNVECGPDCKVPLSSTSFNVFVNCPGCVLPGWNLQAFNVTRINMGYADDDNNNFPDISGFETTSADISLANTSHVMIGDTLEFTIKGITSEAESPAYYFSSIGFEYKYGQIQILGNVVDELEFIGAEGSYYSTLTGNTSSISLPSTYPGIDIITDEMNIDFSTDLLHPYGLEGLVDKFYGSPSSNDSIELTMKFRVMENLNFGSAPTHNYSIEDLTVFLNMSGTEFPVLSSFPPSAWEGNRKIDANPVLELYPSYFNHLQTVDSLKYFNYWCTASMGRFFGVAGNYTQTLEIESCTSSVCENAIRYFFASEVGQDAFSTYTYEGNQMVWNSFAFELRNLWMMDSIMFTFPEEYYYRSAFMKDDQIIYDTLLDLKRWNVYSNVSDETYHPYDFIDERVTDTSVTLYFDVNYDRIQEWVNHKLTAWDETKKFRIFCSVGIEDCQTTPDTINAGGYPIFSYWNNFPGTTTGDTIIEISNGAELFIKPQADISAQQIGPAFNVGGSELFWDLSLNSWNPRCNEPYAYETWRVMAFTENTFVYFESASGDIVVDSVYRYGIPLPVIDTINGNKLFGVGFLSCDTVAPLHVYSSYDCSDLYVADTFITYYGWNCYNYPDTIDLDGSVCYIDTILQVLNPIISGLTTDLSSDDPAGICDTVTFYLDLSGDGLVENIMAYLNNTSEYSYIDGTGQLIFGADTFPIEPNYAGVDSMIWVLDSIPVMQQFSDEATLVFDVATTCGFGSSGNELEVFVTSENFCGFQSSNLESYIPEIIDLPKFDSLQIVISVESMTSCGDSALLSLMVNNLGNDTTGAYNTMEINLPGSFGYLGGYPATVNGSNLTIGINSGILPGTSDTINIYIANDSIENCGTLDIETGLFLATVYYCGEDTCLVENGVADTVITTHLEIQKPDIQITNFTLSGESCSGDALQISFDIENMAPVLADSVYVVISCGNNGFVYDSILYAPFYAEDFIHEEITLDTVCYNCDSIFLQLVSACNCDTVATDTLPLPLNVLFELSDSCFAVGVPIPFLNLSNPVSADWLWDFGNGDFSTDYNPIYAFAEPGYHYVTLTGNYNGATCEQSMLIEVLPDICACNWSMYDNINIVVDEDMTISSDISVYGTITVEPGNTLTIADDRTIRFGPAGQIIVKENAVLHLGRYVVLTSLEEPGCDYMWKGIEVWGSGLLPSNNSVQGIVEHGEKAGMKIKNAHIGILVGKRNMGYLTGESLALWDFSKSGGVLKLIDNSLTMTFEDCGIGVKYISKKNKENIENNVNACVFKTVGTVIDPRYSITNPFKYPNEFNPFNGYANYSQRSNLGLSVWGVWDLKVKGNRFNNVEFGIDSKDARFDIISSGDEGSRFENCKFGIYISNSYQSINYRHNIENCYFDFINDPSYIPGLSSKRISAAIYINNGSFDNINKNTFSNNLLSTSQDNNYTGIYTINTSNFKIIDNDFYKWQYGIISYNSGYGGGNIGPGENLGNSFLYCRKSIVTNNDQHLLRSRCSEFINEAPGGSIPYLMNWDNFGELADQGSMPYITGPFSTPWVYTDRFAAGHTFYPYNRKQIQTWNFEYDYFRHEKGLLESELVSPVIPDVDESEESIFVHNTLVRKDENSCLPILTPLDINQREALLTDMKAYSTELNNQLELIRNNLDNGNTQLLLDAINGNTPTGRLKNLLIENSPLSDEVILLLLKVYPLSHGNFKNVMEKNLPVTDEVQKDFFEKIKEIPVGIANQLIQLQATNQNPATVASLKRQIETVDGIIYLIKSDLIIDAVKNQNLQKAIDLIEQESVLSFYKQLLASTFLSMEEYANAENWLAQLSLDEHYLQWISLVQELKELDQTGNSVYLLDENTIDELYDYSETRPTEEVAATSEGLLYQLYGYVPDMIIPEGVSTRKMEITSKTEDKNRGNAYLGENHPNPFSEETYIPYYIPEGEGGILKIHSADGVLIWQYNLSNGKNELKVETKDWENGVYVYTLEVNEVVVESQKMILIKQ